MSWNDNVFASMRSYQLTLKLSLARGIEEHKEIIRVANIYPNSYVYRGQMRVETICKLRQIIQWRHRFVCSNAIIALTIDHLPPTQHPHRCSVWDVVMSCYVCLHKRRARLQNQMNLLHLYYNILSSLYSEHLWYGSDVCLLYPDLNYNHKPCSVIRCFIFVSDW